MKILQTCGSSSWGGLEKMALQTSEELAGLGHDVTILCKKDSVLFNEGEKSGIKCLALFSDDKSLLKNVRNIKKLFVSENYDIVHTHLSHDLWSLVPASRKSSVKLFLTKHMGSYVSKKDILHKYLYNRVNGIFAISNYVKESVLRTCPVKEDKIKILPDFIKLEKYDTKKYNRNEIRNLYNVDSNTILIGMAGRFTPGKGHEDLIEAAKLIRKDKRDKIKYFIVGGASMGEDEYEATIRKIVKDSGLENDFIFTGFSNDIPKLMNAMDIFVMPSHEESFGIVLLEAMAMQIPVIATDNAGAKDIVINNESGLLIKPKNPGQLAENIMELINDKEKRTKLGFAGRKRVEENFSPDNIINRLLEFYKKV